MLYVRENRRDYDLWFAAGNYCWSYKDVLPYFIKSEDYRNPYLANSQYHRVGGLLTAQKAPYHTPLSIAFVQAERSIGIFFCMTYVVVRVRLNCYKKNFTCPG